MILRSVLVAVGVALPMLALAAAPPTRAQAEAGVTALEAQVSGKIRATWRGSDPLPDTLVGFRSRAYAGPARDVALAFLAEAGPVLGFDATTLAVTGIEQVAGRTSVRLEQNVDGLRVFGRTAAVAVDEAGHVTSVSGLPQPLVVAPRTAELSEADATERALAALKIEPSDTPPATAAERVLLAGGTEARVAFRVVVLAAPMLSHPNVFIDAETGDVLWVFDPIIHD